MQSRRGRGLKQVLDLLMILLVTKTKSPVVNLNKKSKFEYFNEYDPNEEAEPFWVANKPYFSNKHSESDTNIMLKKR